MIKERSVLGLLAEGKQWLQVLMYQPGAMNKASSETYCAVFLVILFGDTSKWGTSTQEVLQTRMDGIIQALLRSEE